jgi:exodeoxyribonuclease VIII
MVDLETLGTGPDAAILAIGAVAFKFEEEKFLATFYSGVTIKSAMKAGSVTPETLAWWFMQGDAQRGAILLHRNTIRTALFQFAAWMASMENSGENILVWGNGADFDNVILSSAFDSELLTRPWGTWNNRCYRTMKNLVPGIKFIKPEIPHNALEDAVAQASHLTEIFKFLNLIGEEEKRNAR